MDSNTLNCSLGGEDVPCSILSLLFRGHWFPTLFFFTAYQNHQQDLASFVDSYGGFILAVVFPKLSDSPHNIWKCGECTTV